MHSILSLFGLLVLFITCTVLAETSLPTTLVSMQIFSSEKNPEWSMTGEDRSKLMNLLRPYNDKLRFECYPQLNQLGLGYQGFTVIDSADEECLHITGVREVESLLFESYVKREQATNTEPKKLAAIIKHVEPLIKQGVTILSSVDSSKTVYDATIAPVRGPDTVTEYDPKKWNVYPLQSHNNCYNYGNDVRTDTFAQPGRGTGKRWELNTCDSVWDASVRDGLIPYSKTKAPAWDEKPNKGHFIALCIWPDVNFHWMKKDLSGYWSHKPGGTQVRDYDSNGKQIKDPANADRSPYTVFCGYLISVPSNMTIN